MSLITRSNCVDIAEENIKVYKYVRIIDGNFHSEFNGFCYKQGVIYETELKTSETRIEMFDKVVTKKYIPDGMKQGSIELKKYIRNNYKCINEGFHSSFSEERLKDKLKDILKFRKNFEIQKFIIPKGSEYYKDETGLLVSNRILWK